MGKTVLIAGKDSPEGSKIADGFAFTGRQVVLTSAEPETDFSERKTITERRAEQAAYDEAKSLEAKSGMCTYEWNRSSPISARALILQTENMFSQMNEAVLYFDEEHFASSEKQIDSEQISRTLDDMVSGFQYLAMEVLARFEKKNNSGAPGTLAFLLKECPCSLDVIKNPMLKNGITSIASPLVAAAAASFVSFAENIAAIYGDAPYVNIILVRGDKSMETVSTDESLGKWLGNYMEAAESLSSKLTAKKSVQWIKPGAKPPASGFNLNFLRGNK